jgi:RNA recognition motif-containing protein
MLTDQRSGKFSGRAFVRMATEAEAKEAVNMLDGTLLINRCIRVSAARDKPAAAPVVEVAEEKPRRRRQPKGRRK